MKEYVLVRLDYDTDENFKALCVGERKELANKIEDYNIPEAITVKDLITGEKYEPDKNHMALQMNELTYSRYPKKITEEEAKKYLQKMHDKETISTYVEHIESIRFNKKKEQEKEKNSIKK